MKFPTVTRMNIRIEWTYTMSMVANVEDAGPKSMTVALRNEDDAWSIVGFIQPELMPIVRSALSSIGINDFIYNSPVEVALDLTAIAATDPIDNQPTGDADGTPEEDSSRSTDSE